LELVKTLTITVITKAIQQIVTKKEGIAPIKTAEQLKPTTEATTHILHQKPTTEATNQILGTDQIVTIDPQEEIKEAQNQEDKNDKKNFRNCYSNQHNT
jgi:hypothetical protein